MDLDKADYYSDSDSDDNDPIKKLNRHKLKREVPAEVAQRNDTNYNPRNPKFSIWSNAIQEDSLMENLRGCDFTNSRKRGRDVEDYNYKLKYRLNGESSNSFKRRKSNSTEDNDSDQRNSQIRRKRKSRKNNNQFKKSQCDDSSNDERNLSPRVILDLTASADCSNEEFARDMSNKLFEDKDDLLLRIVEALGREIPMKFFQETQKIELEGGMLIMNGKRRRTPGGVFLFLLKKSDDVNQDSLRYIFQEDKMKSMKERKDLQQANRDRKVEELKKTLNLNGRFLIRFKITNHF